MKITRYITKVFFLLGCLSLMSSCDYLDKEPDDQLTMEMIFSDKIRTEDWLASVYSSVPSPMWGYYKDQGYNIMADDIVIPSQWTPYGWANSYAFTTGNWSPTSGWSPNYWVELPKRIRTALQFIENVRIIPTDGLTESYVTRMKYEARFLIAYYYSLLVETYGAVPFNPDKIYETGTPSSELMAEQTPADVIVDWIDKEMVEVSKHLPAVYESDLDWGRATSVMALAIRAKTLLFAASPLFNGNTDYADWKNKSGENLINQTYSAEKWQRAATAFKEMITLAESNGYKLYYEYNSDGSIDPLMSYYNMSLKRFSDGNKEIIFGRPENKDLNFWQSHHLPKGIGGNAAMNITQELVDAFQMKDGSTPILGYNKNGSPIINPESGYKERGFSTANEMRKTLWPGGGPTTSFDSKKGERPVTLTGTFNMYCNREPRFYASVIFNNEWLGVANRQVNNLRGAGKDADDTFDSPWTGYNIRKRIALDIFPREGKHSYQPGILYRLADAYLGYAEALNESQGSPSEEVYKYVNLVRERAGLPGLEEGLSKEKMREAIQHERRIEFNCEGVRIQDLRRWKLAEKYLNMPVYGMNRTGTVASDDPRDPKAYYKRWYWKPRVFTKKMYFMPVPQKQMDINTNLVQATGY
ncbi:MAG: RagB/SusD family nutrient uptake outer membrane protein [Prevotella sp.]|jgi:hypothetical protein